jgi:hypothetical protein
VTASKDGNARVWELGSGELVSGLMRHDGAVLTVRFSPDDTLIVTASADAAARIWQAATGQYFGMLLWHRGAVNTASFSPDGRTIVTAANDGTARLWAILRLEPDQTAMLADLAEASGRLTIGDWGTLLPLAQASRDRLMARLQAAARAPEPAIATDFDRLLRELTAPPDTPRRLDTRERAAVAK